MAEKLEIHSLHERSVDFYSTPMPGTTPNVGGLVVDGVIGAKGALLVQCRVNAVVHGTMTDGPDAVPASLICYEFHFFPRSAHSRFTTANISLQFTSGTVALIAPDGQYGLSPDKTTYQVDNSVNPSLTLPIGTATPVLSYKWGRTDSGTHTTYITVTGTISHINRNEADTASLSLIENHSSPDGIPSRIKTAVLLQHDASDTKGKFEAKLKISCDVHGTLEDRLKIDGLPYPRTSQEKDDEEKDEKEEDKAKASEYVMTLYYDAAQKSINPDKIDAKNLGAVKLKDYSEMTTIIVEDNTKNDPTKTGADSAAKSALAAGAA